MGKKNYSFEKFGTKSEKPHIILRHDVDYSVHRALALAKIESKQNIYSTYFFQLRSEFYNIFEKTISSKINQILELGHDVGLHFDLSVYDKKTKKDITHNIKWEKKILSELLNKKISVFSFHNPDLKYALSIPDYKISGMINTYSKKLKNSHYYISDSNGYWRFTRLYDLLKNHNQSKIQILIHPGHWQKSPMSPRKRIIRCIDQRAKNTLQMYDSILKTSKRKNIM